MGYSSLGGSTAPGLGLGLRHGLPQFALEVALACAPGQTLALVGPSGAGKTTLLRLVAGLERPQEGFISLGGQDWCRQPGGLHLPPRQRRVGLVFQDYPLFPHLSLAQNVAFAAAEPGLGPKLLDDFGIAHLAQRRPGEVSGGERQRAAICQALARRPAVLLLDEPLSALDVDARALARGLFRRLAAQWGMCLIMVTHDLLDAVALGGRVEALIQGRLDPAWLASRLEMLAREVAALLPLAPAGPTPYPKGETP